MDSSRFRSSSGRSTASETDHHRLGFSIPRISRKYRSLSFDSGLRLIVSLSGGNQRFESPSPTRLVMATSALNSDRKIVTGPAGYVLEDVPHFSDYIPNPPVRHSAFYNFLIDMQNSENASGKKTEILRDFASKFLFFFFSFSNVSLLAQSVVILFL